MPSDTRSAAAWRKNEGGAIPSDSLLPLFQALYHAAAAVGGTFNSRGALSLVTPSARSCPRVSRLDFAIVSDELSSLAILLPALLSTASLCLLRKIIPEGGTEHPLRKTNAAQTRLLSFDSPSGPANPRLLLSSTASISPPPMEHSGGGDGASLNQTS